MIKCFHDSKTNTPPLTLRYIQYEVSMSALTLIYVLCISFTMWKVIEHTLKIDTARLDLESNISCGNGKYQREKGVWWNAKIKWWNKNVYLPCGLITSSWVQNFGAEGLAVLLNLLRRFQEERDTMDGVKCQHEIIRCLKAFMNNKVRCFSVLELIVV